MQDNVDMKHVQHATQIPTKDRLSLAMQINNQLQEQHMPKADEAWLMHRIMTYMDNKIRRSRYNYPSGQKLTDLMLLDKESAARSRINKGTGPVQVSSVGFKNRSLFTANVPSLRQVKNVEHFSVEAPPVPSNS
jgi:hypothetical protein